MVKLNNKGLSVVELIVSFVLCILVFIFVIQVVSAIEELYVNLGIKTELLNKQSLISQKLNEKFTNKKTILIKNCGNNCLTFFYKDNTSEKIKIDKNANSFIIGDDIYNFNGLGFVDSLIVTTNKTQNYNYEILTINLNVKNTIFDSGKYIIKSLYQYNSNEVVYSASTSNNAEIFLLGPSTTYKFANDVFIEPGWIVYYPSGKITINGTDVQPSKINYDEDGNGSITYRGIGEAAGSEKVRVIRKNETAKDHIVSLYNDQKDGVYLYEQFGKYIYKGANVKNYISIGNKMFRIISLDIQSHYKLDEDGNVITIDGEKQKENKYLLKVVSTDYVTDENNNNLIAFDDQTSNINQSLWMEKVCITETNCEIKKQTINRIVNDIYLQGLLNTGTGKMAIKNGIFNVGLVDFNIYKFAATNIENNVDYTYSAQTIYELEGADVTTETGVIYPGKWHGNCLEDVCGPNAGILTLTDVLFTSNNSRCLDELLVNKSGASCSKDNWLWYQNPNSEEVYRLMTRLAPLATWLLTEYNFLSSNKIYVPYKTRATLFLDANLYIAGDGSYDNPYTLYSINV